MSGHTVGASDRSVASRDQREPRHARRRAAIGAVLFVLAVVLPLFRQSGRPSWDTIWAEDGAICFQQAYREGPFAVMLRPAVGYLQLAPRILGAIATLVPIAALPLYFALAATTVAALLASFTYWASAGWIGSRTVRLALASQIVLMPALGQENTATIINLLWTFLAVVPWALVSRCETPPGVALRAGVAFLAPASTPIAVAFLPLAAWWVWARRSRAAVVVLGAFCAGLALQGVVSLGALDNASPHAPALYRPAAVVVLVAARVFATLLVGPRGIAALWIEHGQLLVVAAPLVTVAVFAVLMPGAGRDRATLALLFIAHALLVFALPVFLRGAGFIPIVIGQPQYLLIHLRFSVAPVLLLLSAVAVLIAPDGPAARRTVARCARPIFVAYVIAVTLSNFPVKNLRSSSPRWSVALASAYQSRCRSVPPDTMVPVRTNFFRLYMVPFSCREIGEAIGATDDTDRAE